MKLKGVRHIFFDLDHTLWDFDKNSALTFEKIFKLNSLELNSTDFIKVYEPINIAYWKLYRNEEIDKNLLRYRRLSDSFKALDIDISDELIHKLSEDYIAHLTSFTHLFQDTISILDYLKTNYSLHIITNGFQEVQTGKLQNSGIAKYFETVTNTDNSGVKKPNPVIFNFALQLANAQASESLMIGDNLEADVLGALNAGMDAVMFNYRKEILEPNIKQVQNLLALKTFL